MANTRTDILERIMMENPLVCFYKLPLKDITIRRMAIILCKTPKLLYHVAYVNSVSNFKEDIQKEMAITCFTENLLAKLSLPESLKEELLRLMKPLCREIAKWFHFHQNYCGIENFHCIDVLKHVCWTPLGTIDNRETAKELIRREKLSIEWSFKLACLYCISDYIPVLWEKLPETESSTNKGDSLGRLPKEIHYWIYVSRGREEKLCNFFRIKYSSSLYQDIFQSLAIDGYKNAVEYFFQKLTGAERQVLLVRTARAVAFKRKYDFCSYRQEYQKYSDVLFYLFSLMSKEELLQVLESHPCEVLKCCLDWPRQEFFVELAQLAFPYLGEEDYCRLLFILSSNIKWGFNYSNIYREFFHISPRNFREYALRHYGYFLQSLFLSADVETVKFVFGNLDAEERAALVFSNSGAVCCFWLLQKHRWDWLEVFFRGAMLSQTDKDKFLMRFPPQSYSDTSLKWKKLSEKFEALVKSIKASDSKCDKATQINLPPTLDFPDIHLEENPAKKLKFF